MLQQSNSTQYLTQRYLLALTTIALLTIIGQVLIQFTLFQQTNDSRIVNIAGRQRMLSQRLSKSALAFQASSNAEDQNYWISQLDTTLSLWTLSSDGLQNGNAELGLPGNNSPEVRALFSNIDPQYQSMLTAAQCLISITRGTEGAATCEPDTSVHVDTILANEAAFLTGMDTIVFQYDAEAATRVTNLRYIEMTLLIITLLVLVLEAFLIFQPAVRSIRNALDAMLKTQAELEKQIIETEAARERAEHSDKVKSAFLASMSHELRTPLNAVINFTKFVAQGDLGTVNDEQKDTLFEVVDSARHLLNLINDVLDMSKIESNSLTLFVQDNLSLQEILENSVSTAKTLIKDKPVELRTKISDLPPIRGDKQRIRQIFLNILSNACKFTEEGFIEIRAETQNGNVIFAFQDTGPGISADDQLAVFEAFKQTKSGLRHGGGTGLGMPISRSLAEIHGGKLWLESEVGKGSTFFVQLPVKSETLVPLNI